jgi:predicted enzyme involved in methoxymalonyl-ACP biosynthesis
MERKIEDQVLGVIENRSFADGYRYISACYIPTEKNRPVETLFERLGYTLMDTDDKGNKKYRLAINQKPERCAFAEIIEK